MSAFQEIEKTATVMSELSRDILTLRDDNQYSDVTLIVEGQKILAHRAILAARHSYFKVMFALQPQNSTQNEFVIPNITYEDFQLVMKYLYSGVKEAPFDVDHMLSVAELIRQLDVIDFPADFISQIQKVLSLKCICPILDSANLPNPESELLRKQCHIWIFNHFDDFLESSCLENLSAQSLINLLKQDEFSLPEEKIFQYVARWCKNNPGQRDEDLVIQCVRLPLLTVRDLVSTVWRSQLVKPEHLMSAINEIIDEKPQTFQPRFIPHMDKNIATKEYGATVYCGENTSNLLTGTNKDEKKYAKIAIDGINGFVVKLGTPSYINHLRIKLYDKDKRYYSYYIEISLDHERWYRIIDFRETAGRSVQNLYFERQKAKYIKIVGTACHNATDNQFFCLVYVEAYCKSSTPKFTDGVIYPETKNVATLEENAVVLKGSNPEYLLDGNIKSHDDFRKFTHHIMKSEHIVVQLAQPFMISRMKLLLLDSYHQYSKFYVETSVNNENWEMVVDNSNKECQGWQELKFIKRAVAFIRITGTYSTEKEFYCGHLECSFVNGTEMD